MNGSPSFDDIFDVMAAASVGDLAPRVVVPAEPTLADPATKLALALNILLDDLALRANHAQRELAERQRSADHLRALAEASEEFSSATFDHDHLLEVVARRLGELVGDMCTVRALTEDGEWLESKGGVYHVDPALLAETRALMLTTRQRVGEGISGRVAATAKPSFTPRVSPLDLAASSEPEYRPFLERLRITSAITLPLLCRGKVVAVANLMRSRPTHPYDEEDLLAVQSVADHAALAIGNARSFAAERVARAEAEEATTALHRAERRFSRLCDAGILGTIVADLEGHIFDVNATLLDLVGYSRAELLSGAVPWRTLTPDEWRAVDLRAIEQLRTTGTAGLREKELIRKDGTRVPVLAGSAMLDDGTNACISFLLDITERKVAQAAVAHMREELAVDARFRALLESAPDAMVIVRGDGAIVLVNRQAEALFGYARGEIIGRPVEALIPERYRDAHVSHRGGYFQAARIRSMGAAMELYAQRKDGTEFPIEVSLSPLETEDGILVSSAIRDITDRRRAEVALARAKDAAEASNRELESFSYSVAHDLRAPLRGMNGFAQALVDTYGDKFDEEGRDWLGEIMTNAQKMGALIDALLSLSRVTRSEMKRESVDISVLARAAVKRLSDVEPRRAVELVIQDSVRADLDPVLARSLIDNLIGNAWKFTSRAAAARIELGTVERDGTAAFFVRDNGAGFDMAFASKLFAPFQRLHTAAEYPGTGIGLATVERIVLRHGGRIWAEGAVDMGATFYFAFSQTPGEPSAASGVAS